MNTDREPTTRRIAGWKEGKEMGETLSGTVTTEGGTPVAYWRSGKGPPLVLVHGTAADHSRWRPVIPALEESFTVYAIDRRGRGGSGDAEDYSVEKEFEDVAAVVDSLGEPVNLLGHSYGGLLALEAALLTRNVRKLVLYDSRIEWQARRSTPTRSSNGWRPCSRRETGTGWSKPRCARSPG
jgi:pimeloyl-ACP methyl ester carboxylesterase